MSLLGGVAVVTGGGSGLGRATAELLANRGARVAVLDLSDSGRDVADDLGGVFMRVDITDEAAVARAVEEAADLAPVRIVVNCAGGSAASGRTVSHGGRRYPSGGWRAALDLNLTASFYVLSYAAAAMAQTSPVDEDGQRGVIVLTSSIAGLDGATAEVGYASAKAGVAALATSAARDLVVHGIRVVAIAPGVFDTPLLRRIAERVPRPERDLAQNDIFPARPGRPEEFADAVDFVVRNAYVNGACLRIDGGGRMR